MSATARRSGCSSSEAGRAHAGDDGDMESLNNNGKMVNDRAGHARHEGPALFPSGSVSLNPIVRGPFDHELLGRAGAYVSPLSLPPIPISMLDATVDLEPISSSA